MRGFVSIALVAPFVLAGCMQSDTDGGVGGRSIVAGDDFFDPVSATASVGDTFTFTNEGQRSHTVTVHRPPDASDSYIKDDTLTSGEETSLSFDKAGTYHVFCTFHGAIGTGMHITVTVAA